MGSVRALACILMVAGAACAAPVPALPKNADDDASLTAVKLLKNRKIQKELKLNAEQRIAIVDGLADIDESIDKKRMALLKEPSPTPDKFEKLEKESQDAKVTMLRTTATKGLTPAQRSRLKQITRQIHGPESFNDPALQKLLAFTDAQKKTVATFEKQLEEKITSYLSLLGNDDSDNRKEELLKFREESLKSFVAGLAMDQREVWKSLLGEPVKGFDAIELWFTILEEDDDKPMP